MTKKLRIGIVAGESSGDILGASLIASLKRHYPEASVEGIGGPLMKEQGCHSFFPMDRLSVMGLIEPLKRLPELLHIRKTLREHFLANPPDVFIGIDSPDFNLPLEKKFKQAGIKTVHYVSPSVWAWRQKRIFKIKQSVDLMLTLFPFEQDIYQQHNIPVCFVGHPLADQFDLQCDKQNYRQSLDISVAGEQKVIALLPGSREGEVSLLAPELFAAAQACFEQDKTLCFLIPAASPRREAQINDLLKNYTFPRQVFAGRSHEVMGASDMVVMASGTTTLEAMLLKKPMVVTYKMAPLSYAIISRMLKTPYVALPNLLAQKMLVPELLQEEANGEGIAKEVLSILQSPDKQQSLEEAFLNIHQSLRCEAGERAAQAVRNLVEAESVE